jgi:hypothetical protein
MLLNPKTEDNSPEYKSCHERNFTSAHLTYEEAKKILEFAEDYDDIQTIYAKAQLPDELYMDEENNLLLKQYMEENDRQSSQSLKAIDDSIRIPTRAIEDIILAADDEAYTESMTM